MNCRLPIRVVALIICLTALNVIAQQRPAKKPPKPTEEVVLKYQKLVTTGAFLSPEGWKRAGKLFSRSAPYPGHSEIFLIAVGYVGEDWQRGTQAQVESKWGDNDGSIDSKLRYHPPQNHHMTIFTYSLIYTDRHEFLDKNGATIRVENIAPGWRIKGPQKVRIATIKSVIPYLENAAAESSDPAAKANAAKTLKILRKPISGCRQSANAC